VDAILYTEKWVGGRQVESVARGEKVEYRVVVDIQPATFQDIERGVLSAGWSLFVERHLPTGLKTLTTSVYSRLSYSGTWLVPFEWTEEASEPYEIRMAIFDDGVQISKAYTETFPVRVTPIGHKTADLTIYFIRVLPVSDEELRDQITAGVNTFLKLYALAGEELWVEKPTVSFLGSVLGVIPNYQYKAEIYSKGTPFPWAAFIYAVAFAMGITAALIYLCDVKPLEEALQEVEKDAAAVKGEIDLLVSQGKITEEEGEALKSKLTSIEETAEESGKSWVDQMMEMIKPVLELLPVVVVAIVAVAVIGGVMSMMPARR
jgi:hypothetical protein